MKIKETALEYALKSLSLSEQSEKCLREKLSRKNYPAEEIENAINRLKEKRYLSDEEGCARRFELLYEESSKSMRQIKEKLIAKGYGRELIASLLPAKDEAFYQRELKAALQKLQSRYKAPTEPKKMLAYLGRQGFDFSVCKDAIGMFQGEE